MKPKTLLFCLISGVLPFLSANAQPAPNGEHKAGVGTLGGAIDESDAGGAARVDVVVDMFPAGKKIAPPTPDHPTYYLPMPMGYKEFGFEPYFQRTPPSADEVEHMLGVALHQQGFEIMTHQNHPTLVLYFWWGYMAPPQRDAGSSAQVKPSATGAADINSVSQIASAQAASGDVSEDQMRQLVLGESLGDEGNPYDPRKQEALHMTRDARYYILVSAFDFDSWLKNLKEEKNKQPGEKVADQPILLWRAHISTELWGHYFDQVAQTLISAGAPWFGRETHGPQIATEPIAPSGRVILGTPEVKDYGTKAPAP